MGIEYEEEMSVAIDAVRCAGVLCQAVRASLVSDETVAKMDKSPVTVADFGAQAVIISAIRKVFPDDMIVAEEDTGALRGDAGQVLLSRVLKYVQDACPDMSEAEMLTAIDGGQHCGGAEGRFWTIDPIDGTKGYIRGDQYAVALGLIVDGEVALGILGCPNLPVNGLGAGGECGVILSACRGGGTFQHEIVSGDVSRVSVSAEADPAKAVFCESVESAHTAHGASADVVKRLGVAVEPARLDSQCKYAVVARGDAGVYMRLPTRPDYEEKIWDHAAGVVIVEEAGGVVTDVDGKPLDFSRGRTLCGNRGVIATNGQLHGSVLGSLA